MQPDFQLLADSIDVTETFRDRLLELRLTDKPGLESDELEIRLDDRDGKIAFPSKGTTLKLAIGWKGQTLTPMGSFEVDEIELSSPPRSVSLRAKPTGLRQDSRTTLTEAYEGTTLAAIVAAVAGRNGWEPICKVDAQVPRADQQRESDLQFITRLSRNYGATATVKENKLLVLPRDGGQSASGKALPKLTITPPELSRYSLKFPDRASFAQVKASSHNPKTGELEIITLDNDDSSAAKTGGVHTDRHPYATPEAAKAAAQSKLDSLNRATASGSLECAGRSDISAEATLTLSGFKSDADGDYLVESVTHSLNKSGWRLSIELSAGNQGKAKVGKKPKAALQIVHLDKRS